MSLVFIMNCEGEIPLEQFVAEVDHDGVHT